MSQWYYTSGGAQQGPVSTEELQAWIAAGQLAVTELVWREGMGDWQPISLITELASSQHAADGGYGVAWQAPLQPSDYVGGGQYQLGYGAPAYGGQPGHTTTLQYHNPNYGQRMVYAGFWWRFLAAIIDMVILNVAGLIVGFVFGIAATSARSNVHSIELGGNVIGILIGWLYSAFLESSTWQGTIGKKACGIVVTDLNGQRIGFGKATGRHFGKILSGLILLIGYIMQAFTEKRQALHDMMAGCLVLKNP